MAVFLDNFSHLIDIYRNMHPQFSQIVTNRIIQIWNFTSYCSGSHQLLWTFGWGDCDRYCCRGSAYQGVCSSLTCTISAGMTIFKGIAVGTSLSCHNYLRNDGFYRYCSLGSVSKGLGFVCLCTYWSLLSLTHFSIRTMFVSEPQLPYELQILNVLLSG